MVCDSYKGAFARGSGWGDFPREGEADGIELASIFEHSRERCGHKWASNLSKTQVHAGNPSILLGYTCIYSIKTSMPVAAMTVDFHLMCCFQERSRIHSYPRETLARGN